MIIHQITGASEGWRAVFLIDGELRIRPVVAWGLVQGQSHEEVQRFVDGFTLDYDGTNILPVNEQDCDGGVFIRYLSPGETPDEAALMKKGQEISDARWKRRLTKKLGREPTKEEVDIAENEGA